MTDTCIVCLGDLRVATEATIIIKRDPDGDDLDDNDDGQGDDGASLPIAVTVAAPLPMTATNQRYPRLNNPFPIQP